MRNAIFYHAGCPVCIDAEQQILGALDSQIAIDIVHLGDKPASIQQAESRGVQSVPALVLDDQVFHINFGAALVDLKGES
ncbi:thioredoxin family protein [Pseudoteredinibacter isoporae]|uniref:Glutaredoxin n=1 Tax=Pseudoteredinibacter isoporae TaxID=570281 RepID=A0A7X0MW73_9GAMM|nr:thioredoxin family protein [Pseudoteredinibacter isoporae]MBB6521895.1 glutaredoxin [Pseudoteredinibacter isoporae]NHO87439.1 thioredoxin family protein [Pseudoteredinibacter isoporae]NIB24230.1 thioredoxin family protein [Pseudoteredinibacter isoporae]